MTRATLFTLALLTGCAGPSAQWSTDDYGAGGAKAAQGVKGVQASACVCKSVGCKVVDSGWYTGSAAVEVAAGAAVAGRRSTSTGAVQR